MGRLDRALRRQLKKRFSVKQRPAVNHPRAKSQRHGKVTADKWNQ